jgi:hypothetical protein
LGKRVAPEDDEGRCHSPSTGPHPLGIGEQVRAENLGGFQAHSGLAPIECAPSSPEDQVRDAQHGTFFEQVTRRWGICGYVVGVLCLGDRCGFSVIYVFLSGWVILC